MEKSRPLANNGRAALLIAAAAGLLVAAVQILMYALLDRSGPQVPRNPGLFASIVMVIAIARLFGKAASKQDRLNALAALGLSVTGFAVCNVSSNFSSWTEYLFLSSGNALAFSGFVVWELSHRDSETVGA